MKIRIPRLHRNAFRTCVVTALLGAGLTARAAAAPARVESDTLWLAQGTRVVVPPAEPQLYQVCSDLARGAFVSMMEFRNHNADVSLQHVGPLGQRLTPDSTGALVCVLPGAQLAPQVAPNGDGGAYLAWRDDRSNPPAAVLVEVSSNGAIAPGWPSNGIVLGPFDSTLVVPALAADDAGGAFVCWTDRSAGQRRLVCDRWTHGGVHSPGWSGTPVVLCAIGDVYSMPRMIADSTGGAIVAWSDRRNGSLDLYAMRVLGNGSLAPGWPLNGVSLGHDPGDEWLPGDSGLLADGTGGAFITWSDAPTDSEDVWLTRVRADGSIPTGFGDAHREVLSGPGRQDA